MTLVYHGVRASLRGCTQLPQGTAPKGPGSRAGGRGAGPAARTAPRPGTRRTAGSRERPYAGHGWRRCSRPTAGPALPQGAGTTGPGPTAPDTNGTRTAAPARHGVHASSRGRDSSDRVRRPGQPRTAGPGGRPGHGPRATGHGDTRYTGYGRLRCSRPTGSALPQGAGDGGTGLTGRAEGPGPPPRTRHPEGRGTETADTPDTNGAALPQGAGLIGGPVPGRARREKTGAGGGAAPAVTVGPAASCPGCPCSRWCSTPRRRRGPRRGRRIRPRRCRAW